MPGSFSQILAPGHLPLPVVLLTAVRCWHRFVTVSVIRKRDEMKCSIDWFIQKYGLIIES